MEIQICGIADSYGCYSARRMIAKLLKADASFFHEYHYLNPLLVDSSDQVEL
jgi:hypothetical protein